MVSGKVPGMQGMSGMAPSLSGDNSQYHIELHVISNTTGKAVHGAKVTIAVSSSAIRKPVVVPIAVMYGVAQGEADWHYGNSVQLVPGQYVVLVSANGEQAKFDVTVPAM